MRAQVDSFHEATGEKVSIVAESEGALVAQAYLSATPDAPVSAAVLLSPLLEPGRVFYPSLGESGWGVVSGTILDGIATTLAAVGPVDVTADAPLFRSLVDEAPALRPLLRCRVPGVREFAVLPLDSGVSAPAFVDAGEPSTVVPAFHGGLLGDATTKEIIADVLRGRRAEGSGFWSAAGDAVNAIAAAWQAPSIEPDLVPEWSRLPDPDDCAAARAEVERWLDQ
jgi:pimeloyl-ACP methyl ester carboxylesterase